MDKNGEAVSLLREFCSDIRAVYGAGPVEIEDWFDLADTYAKASALLKEISGSPDVPVNTQRVESVLREFCSDMRGAYGLDPDEPEDEGYGVDGIDVDELGWPDLFETYQKVCLLLGKE